jgi:hypothetical protein
MSQNRLIWLALCPLSTSLLRRSNCTPPLSMCCPARLPKYVASICALTRESRSTRLTVFVRSVWNPPRR